MAWVYGLLDFKWTSETGSDGRCVSSYMQKWLLRTDQFIPAGPVEVASVLGIYRGSPFPDDPNAICNRLDIGPGPVITRPPFLAYTVEYGWATNAYNPAQDDDDPTTMRTLWSISPQIQSRYVIKDRLGRMIKNTAGSPYDGGIPMDVRLGTITAKRNVTATGYDRAAVLANSGKLNSVTWEGGEPGTVQVDISAEERYEGAFHFWAETYTFCYDPAGWQPKPVSAGFFQRATVGSNYLLRMTNGDLGDTNPETMYMPTQEPEPLDSDGILVPIANRPASVAIVEVDLYDTMDFNDFNL